MDRYSKGYLDMLATFVDNADVGLYVTDYRTCEILLVNRKMAVYCGKSDSKELVGRICWSLISPDAKGRCSFCPYKKLIDGDGKPTQPYSWELYHPLMEKWLAVINRSIYWPDGRLAHMVTFHDITEMKNMQEQLANLAFKDKLLGLKNETSLEQDVGNAPVKPSLIVFDILSLQKINEVYGRDAGDHYLRSVRDWIIGQNIPDSELYRIDGDEFCLAVRDISHDDLKELADTLMHRFSQPWFFDLKFADNSTTLFCNASVAAIQGIYIHEDEPLLNLIERTLNTAKKRKRLVVYDRAMDGEYKEHLRFEWSLKRCVRENMDGFDVHFQPIVDSAGGMWCGLEALCRWDSPEFDSVPPLLFIPEAERLELIGPIGLWVLEESVRKCKMWGLDRHDSFLLDVNVSAVQLLDETLYDKIVEILRKHDYPGGKLCLEITESTQFTFIGGPLYTLMRLKEFGILLALDDFGTGYSSFNSLKNLPVDIVKIEREFVVDIENNKYHQYLFNAIVELSHMADKTLVAEGVERQEQMEILVGSGADRLQGYLFEKPLPSCDLEKRLHRFCR